MKQRWSYTSSAVNVISDVIDIVCTSVPHYIRLLYTINKTTNLLTYLLTLYAIHVKSKM